VVKSVCVIWWEKHYKLYTVLSSFGVVLPMCIFANCICLACIVVILCVFVVYLCVFVVPYVYLLYLMCICFTMCVLLFFPRLEWLSGTSADGG
jgi:hypothetical protein